MWRRNYCYAAVGNQFCSECRICSFWVVWKLFMESFRHIAKKALDISPSIYQMPFHRKGVPHFQQGHRTSYRAVKGQLGAFPPLMKRRRFWIVSFNARQETSYIFRHWNVSMIDYEKDKQILFKEKRIRKGQLMIKNITFVNFLCQSIRVSCLHSGGA